MQPLRVWQLLRESVGAWQKDRSFRMAAAIAYYSVFSISPLLLIVLSVARMVFGEQAARGELRQQLEILVGAEPAAAIEEILRNTRLADQHGLLVGALFLLVCASWVFLELRDALNTIWNVAQPQRMSLLAEFRSYLLSISLVLCTGLLLMVLLALGVAAVALAGVLEPSFPWFPFLHGVTVIGSFLLVALLFALIYRFLPDARVRWREAWIGAFVTAGLHSLGHYAICLYLGHSTFTSAFGALSAVVVFLLWVYYSAALFLLGAKFTYVFALRTRGVS
jgi:membrane protein